MEEIKIEKILLSTKFSLFIFATYYSIKDEWDVAVWLWALIFLSFALPFALGFIFLSFDKIKEKLKIENNNTLNTYNNTVEAYFNTNKENSVVEKQLDYFISTLNGNKVIDVGCGFGRDTNYMSNKGVNVLGIDASEGLLEKAGELYPECNFQKFNLLKDDYSKLPKVSGLWCCASLLHFTPAQMRTVLCRLLELLEEEGTICVSLKTNKESGSYRKDGRWFQVYMIQHIEKIFSDIGLEIIKKESNPSSNGKETFTTFYMKRKESQ